MKKQWKKILHFIYKTGEDYVMVHSACSTLFVLLSLFPLVMFILSLLSRLGIGWGSFLTELLSVTPSAFRSLIISVVENIAARSGDSLLSVSVLVMLWTASSGVYWILQGLNDVYRTYDTRSWLFRRGLSILYTVVLILAVIVNIVLLGYGNKFLDLFIIYVPKLRSLLELVRVLRYPALLILYTLFFCFLYRMIPVIPTRFADHLPGALCSGLGWLLLSYFYSLYVDYYAELSLYGSLTMIILFILWLRYSMLILFLGAELNSIRIDRKYGKDTSELRSLSRAHILETEAKIKSSRKILPTEKMALRKATNRNGNDSD